MILNKGRTVRSSRLFRLVIASGVAAALAMALAYNVTANDEGRGCSNGTLRGSYGYLVSGNAPAGPSGQTEITIGTVLRNYDGQGGFTQIDNVHGQVSGVVQDRHAGGTYTVNADCTGTATLAIPGVPFPIISAIVVVDGGKQVMEAVMSPQPALVTSTQNRVR